MYNLARFMLARFMHFILHLFFCCEYFGPPLLHNFGFRF